MKVRLVHPAQEQALGFEARQDWVDLTQKEIDDLKKAMLYHKWHGIRPVLVMQEDDITIPQLLQELADRRQREAEQAERERKAAQVAAEARIKRVKAEELRQLQRLQEKYGAT